MLDDANFVEMPQERDNLEATLVRVVRELGRDSEGLLFLQWLVAECGALKSEYPADHVRAAYREGKREVGVRIVILAQAAGVAGKLVEAYGGAASP